MRLRRRRGADHAADGPETDAAAEASEAPAKREDGRDAGPWDEAEVDLEDADEPRLDLGGLLIPAVEGVEVRLQVDERTSAVQAVMLIAEDAAMELRPFAAPRHEDLWEDVRRQLRAQATQRGGTADEVDGPFGPALRLALPVTTQDGRQGSQPSTVWGIRGPRWLLRVSTFGRAALEYRPDEPLETLLRGVVVRRGTGPMPPGESLPLQVPAGARRGDEAAADEGSAGDDRTNSAGSS